MDQETLRLLITATASVAAGLIGALIGFASAQRVATRTLQGQRQPALDKDLRDARRESMRVVLNLLSTSAIQLIQAAEALKHHKFDEFARLIDVAQVTDRQMSTSVSLGFLMAGELDPDFKKTLDQCLDQFMKDGALTTQIDPRAVVEEISNMPPDKIDEFINKQVEFVEIFVSGVTDLHRAAEAYWSRLT